MKGNVKRRSFTKLDMFGLLDLVREHRLTATEQLTLIYLVGLANFRSQTWIGTMSSLEADTLMSRNTLRANVARLESAGLITVLDPPGRNRPAAFRIDAFNRLIVPEHRASIAQSCSPAVGQDCATEPHGGRAASEQPVGSQRAANGQSCAIEQDETRRARKRGSEEGMASGVRREGVGRPSKRYAADDPERPFDDEADPDSWGPMPARPTNVTPPVRPKARRSA